MLKTFAKSLLVGAVQKKAGVTKIGAIPGTLITTGASLALTRGRRPVGLALAVAGGLLLWWEIERDRAATLEEGLARPEPLPAPSSGASAATPPR